jgi:hypothetical protein
MCECNKGAAHAHAALQVRAKALRSVGVSCNDAVSHNELGVCLLAERGFTHKLENGENNLQGQPKNFVPTSPPTSRSVRMHDVAALSRDIGMAKGNSPFV